MPKIELTDEQAEELIDTVDGRIDDLSDRIERLLKIGEDALELQHVRSVLSDILHLLEIA
jgi:hypothetical protein